MSAPVIDRRKGSDTWIFMLIGLVLMGAFTIVISSLLQLPERRDGLARAGADRVVRNLRSKVLANLDFKEKELRREVAFVLARDTVNVQHALERWVPLMDSDPSISAIRLANVQGEQIAVIQDTAETRIAVTRIDSTGVLDTWTRRIAANGGLDTNVAPIRAERATDARTAAWFSRSLEEHQGMAVWIEGSTKDSVKVLQLAELIRPDRPNENSRVLSMELRPNALLSGLARHDDQRTYLTMVMAADGSQLLNVPSDSTIYGRALNKGLALWKEAQMAGIAQGFDQEGHPMLLQLRRVSMNGTSVHVGVLIDAGLLQAWLAPEERILWWSMALLVALTGLLILAFVRNLGSLRTLRREQHRSRNQEKRLAKALGEREMLDREVHHRVKNNLQVVSSLLNIQAQRVPEGPTRVEFLRSKQRIDIMAVVHHKLYGLSDLSKIELKPLFTDLANSIAGMHAPRSKTVSYSMATNGVRCDPDTAIELGIILCELMANCYEHAFPLVTGGHIDVQLHHVEGDLHRLSVKDNGKGMEDDALNKDGRLGLEIVSSLAERLDGTFKHRSGDGVTFDVLFRMKG